MVVTVGLFSSQIGHLKIPQRLQCERAVGAIEVVYDTGQVSCRAVVGSGEIAAVTGLDFIPFQAIRIML